MTALKPFAVLTPSLHRLFTLDFVTVDRSNEAQRNTASRSSPSQIIDYIAAPH